MEDEKSVKDKVSEKGNKPAEVFNVTEEDFKNDLKNIGRNVNASLLTPIPQLDGESDIHPTDANYDKNKESNTQIVDIVIISSVSEKANMPKLFVEKEIRTTFYKKGVNIKQLIFVGTPGKYFDTCVADISTVSLEKICGTKLKIEGCSISSYW